MTPVPLRLLLCASLSAIVLAGCGGGGGSSDSSSTTTTTTTTTTVTAPSITTQPSGVSATAGSAVTLSVIASGSSLAYQWSKDGVALSGATSASFTLANAATSDSGAYTVAVSNSAGSVTSAAATVTITAASTGTGTTTTAETWNIATGANAADLHESISFQRVALALDTKTLSSTATTLAVSGSTVTQSGTTVLTLSEDSLGLVLTVSAASTTPLEIALSGSSTRTVTVYSSSPFKLSLEGVSIASTDGPALNVQSQQRAFVVLSGSNVLTDTSTYTARTLADGTAMDLKATLFSEGPLVFSGSGSLAVTAASKHALASDAHVRLRSGTFTLTATKKDGLRVNNAVVIDGGTLTIATAAGKGIKVEGKESTTTPLGFIAINGGSIGITSHDKAITASWESAEDGSTTTLADDPDPRVTINGGSISIVTTGTPYEDTNLADGDSSLSPEGIEAKSVLTINGGTIVVKSTDDALNAGTGIVITGGHVYAEASANDAIDSNGTLTITGGVVVANGAGGAEGGLDCDSNTFTVTGGTFIGFGGRNSTVTRSVTTQNTVALRSLSAQSYVLRDAAGNAAVAFTLPKASTAVLVSAPGLATGSTYSLVSGGTLGSYAELFNGLVVGTTTHSGGTATGTSFTVTSTVMAP